MTEPVLDIPFADAFRFDPSPTVAELPENRPVARVRTLARAEVWLAPGTTMCGWCSRIHGSHGPHSFVSLLSAHGVVIEKISLLVGHKSCHPDDRVSMEIEEYGLAQVLKPHIDDDELRQVDSLEGDGSLADFDYADRAVRHLAVAERTLLGGRMSKIEAERVTFDRVSLQSVLIADCVLASSDWMDCALSRVVFRNCKILGANFVENKWASVVFQNCRIEYATFDSVQATAPIVFIDTRFKDVTFRRSEFPGGHMARCTLDNVEFDGGTYTDFDFRSNDLSTIRGASYLNGVLINPVQRQEIAEALVSELDLRYPDRGDR